MGEFKMKNNVLFCLPIFIIIGCVGQARSDANHCYSIIDADLKNDCLGQCYSIIDTDLKKHCLSQVESDVKYCYSIINTDLKNHCFAQVK
jgi:hypothetical protein